MTYPLPAWQDSPSVATPLDATNLLLYNTAINGLSTSVSALSTSVSALAGSQIALTVTGVKVANYTASPNEYVPADTTSGSITVTFPTAPANGTQVGVKQVVRGGTNTVTLQLGGSDKFNTSTGSQTGTLTLLNQDVTFQYVTSAAVWIAVASDTPLSQLDARYVGSVTAGDSTVTVGGTAIAPTVRVSPNGYSAGGLWAPTVYGTQFENIERDDVTTGLAMTGTTHTFLVLLGWCPASTYASFKLYVTASAASVTLTAALYSAATLTNTSWARLGSGNVTPVVTATGLVSTSLAFTLASPAYVALEMALTSGTNLPSFGASTALATTGASGFINPASGCPVLGTLNASSAPGATLNPTTGFTAGAQKIWCALA